MTAKPKAPKDIVEQLAKLERTLEGFNALRPLVRDPVALASLERELGKIQLSYEDIKRQIQEAKASAKKDVQ